jgi:hypothetical protein
MSNLIKGNFGLRRYEDKISKMDKLELLQEMVVHQEERAVSYQMSPDLIQRGLILFKALAEVAESKELRDMCRNYVNKLCREWDSLER